MTPEMFIMSSLCFLVLSSVSALEDHQEIKVKPGQDVPLQCRGPRDASIQLLEWSRTDLKEDGCVFFYRDKRLYENYQLPSFRGRVELRDPEMKDGDASVILKNVTINDTGTYECRGIMLTRNETTRSEIKHLIDLTVTDSDHTAGNIHEGNKDGHLNVIVIVIIIIGIIIIIISCVIHRKRKRLRDKPTSRPAEKETDYQQV